MDIRGERLANFWGPWRRYAPDHGPSGPRRICSQFRASRNSSGSVTGARQLKSRHTYAAGRPSTGVRPASSGIAGLAPASAAGRADANGNDGTRRRRPDARRGAVRSAPGRPGRRWRSPPGQTARPRRPRVPSRPPAGTGPPAQARSPARRLPRHDSGRAGQGRVAEQRVGDRERSRRARPVGDIGRPVDEPLAVVGGVVEAPRSGPEPGQDGIQQLASQRQPPARARCSPLVRGDRARQRDQAGRDAAVVVEHARRGRRAAIPGGTGQPPVLEVHGGQ